MKTFISTIMIFLLLGCAVQKFEIVTTTDKFEDPNAPQGYTGLHNRLSTKSSKGGGHLDDKGVYIDPFVFKDKKNNEIKSLGFNIHHFNFEVNDGFNPIYEIIFLTDKNERIVLKTEYIDSDFEVYGWNPISKQYNTSFSESYIAYASFNDFIKFSNAGSLEAKIVGKQRSQTYPKDKIEKLFLSNIKQFFNERIF